MSQSTESRVALAVIATALLMSMIWIFSDISADVTASSEPVWRYTSEGWQELSDLTPPSPQAVPGLVDNVAPLVWAAIQLLAALAILIFFAEESSHRESSVKAALQISPGERGLTPNNVRHDSCQDATGLPRGGSRLLDGCVLVAPNDPQGKPVGFTK